MNYLPAFIDIDNNIPDDGYYILCKDGNGIRELIGSVDDCFEKEKTNEPG